MRIVTGLLIPCLVSVVFGGRHGHNLPDNTEAREVFHRADFNDDFSLSTDELHQVFLDFDTDNDTYITSDEWLADWKNRHLGDPMEGIILFHHLDVDRNGEIHESVDLPYIIKYFDHDHDGEISQAEFVTQWIKMMNARRRR